MSDLGTLRILYSDAVRNLEQARNEFESLKKRLELAAQVDEEARKILAGAEKKVRSLERQVQDLAQKLAQAQAAEEERKAAQQEELARRRLEAERALPELAKRYREAAERAAAAILRARTEIAPLVEEVLTREVELFEIFDQLRTKAHTAERVDAAEELIRRVFRGFTWPAKLSDQEAEDLLYFARLVAGQVAWPRVFLRPLLPPPPRVRRKYAQKVRELLRARALARKQRLAQKEAA